MARTYRRSYFAALQRRAGTHVLLPPYLRGRRGGGGREGGEGLVSKPRIAKRVWGTTRNDDGGKGAERRRKGDARIVDSRCKGYEGSVLLRRFLSRPRCRAGFPRGTFTVDRRRRRTCAIGRENVLLRKYRACRQVDRLSRGCYEREYLHPRVENALCNRRKTRSGFFFFSGHPFTIR